MFEKEIDELEQLLERIDKSLNESVDDDHMENLYVYICMLLASDKLENNIKLSTRHKIDELKEYFHQLKK